LPPELTLAATLAELVELRLPGSLPNEVPEPLLTCVVTADPSQTELPTVLALGDGAALLLDLEERAVVVLAAGGAVSLDAGLTIRDV
jgi:hypothetical protein